MLRVVLPYQQAGGNKRLVGLIAGFSNVLNPNTTAIGANSIDSDGRLPRLISRRIKILGVCIYRVPSLRLFFSLLKANL